MKNLIYSIFLGLAISSCNWIYKKSPNEQALLDQEIAKVNWDQVDEFPKISLCDSLDSEDLKKECLYNFLVQTTQERFGNEVLALNTIDSDTLWLALTINTDSSVVATPDLSSIYNEVTAQQLNDLISKKLDSLPKIIPGSKNGFSVKTQFNVPLVLHKN